MGEYADGPREVKECRFVFDSDLNRRRLNMPSCFPRDLEPHRVPETLVRTFRIEVRNESGEWTLATRVEESHQRLVRVPVNVTTSAIRFIPEATWGAAGAPRLGRAVAPPWRRCRVELREERRYSPLHLLCCRAGTLMCSARAPFHSRSSARLCLSMRMENASISIPLR